MATRTELNSLRRIQRGTTLVELLFTLVLTAMVLATTSGIYIFTMTGISQSAAEYSARVQAAALADEIALMASRSVDCSIVTFNSRPALRLRMPLNVIDRSGDGYPDEVLPAYTTQRGVERWGAGSYVYFLQSGEGKAGSEGENVFRALTTSPALPTSLQIDKVRGFVAPGRPRYFLIRTLTFAWDPIMRTLNLTIVAGQAGSSERAGDLSDPNTRLATEQRQIVLEKRS